MSTLKAVWKCLKGPKLVQIYGGESSEKIYQPNGFEKWGDQIIQSLYVIWKIGVYTSPFLVGFLYHGDYFTVESWAPFSKLVTSISVILIVSYCCKGSGRLNNPTYMKFLTVYEAVQKGLSPETKKELLKYDFDFKKWPIEFDMRTHKKSTRGRIYINKPILDHSFTEFCINIPLRIIAYVAINTFGIRLIYPGSIGLLQMFVGSSLLQGRARLIEDFDGERFKLKTIDSNSIDSVFIDRRRKTPEGNTLVICCEGNAGFYEIGIMSTTIEAGYSTLGWNHPGFGGSTGKPFPRYEQNAVDAVIQFAINRLGFKLENILLFGWSIGGYTTSWAAMNYPDIKGVIIDATFDDILPLALNHMPKWWKRIVHLAIREHVNLNIGEQLIKYPGPVLLIRRTEDEIISLIENDLMSNRGNYLLSLLLSYRYPYIYEARQTDFVRAFLSGTPQQQDLLIQRLGLEDNVCSLLLQSYIAENPKTFPMRFGEKFEEMEKAKMAIFLVRKHMKDFKATHCVNLPAELFEEPWDFNIESNFVIT